MNTPKDNIFTSFRGPSSRKSKADLGAQLEDNTTKALLHVLDYGNADIQEAVLSALTESLAEEEAVRNVPHRQSGTIETETQVQIKDIDHEQREILFVGVSDRGVDPLKQTTNPEIEGEEPDTSELRVDGVIYVERAAGTSFVIVEESKFNGNRLELSDTGVYKETLGIPAEQYQIISWLDIYRELEKAMETGLRLESDEPPATTRSAFIAEEFMRYLQIYGLTLSTSQSTYGEEDEGVNTVSLEFQPAMNVRTTEAIAESPDYAIHFDTAGATGYLDFYATQNEWISLLEELATEHHNAREILKSNTDEKAEEFFEYIDTELNPSARMKLAEIGAKETGRKWMQVAPKDGYHVIGFKYASPGKNEPPGGYFMLGESELREHFEETSEPDGTSAFEILFAENPDIRDLR